MNEKLKKIIKYVKGAGILYGFYGIKYKLDNEIDFSRRKYGKKKFIYIKIKKMVKKYQNPVCDNKLTINKKDKQHLEKFPIWVCWFQGINQAPEIAGLKKANVVINRKMLADLAITDPKAFTELANVAKKA